MIGWLGTKALAAIRLFKSCLITYMLHRNISAAAIRVGNAVGQENIIETRRSGFSALL